MAHCIEQALEDEALRIDLTQKGIARAAAFDWGRCAAQTLTVLESVLAWRFLRRGAQDRCLSVYHQTFRTFA